MKDHKWIERNGKRLSAMIHMPELVVENPPVVILCHGFTGEKVGGNQFVLGLANAVEAAGFAAVRFDFSGSGESAGEFARDTTISGWKDDLNTVVEWVHEQPAFQKSPIYVLGHSLGGCIALLHDDTKIPVAGRIALAPVIHPRENFHDIILGPELWAAAESGKTISHFYGKAMSLQPDFVRDLIEKGHAPIKASKNYENPVLLIHGTADTAVPAEGSEQFAQAYEGRVDLFLMEDADHSFARQVGELQEKIVDWLTEQSNS
ncbi:alpha/beta fold hydrolase [Brevibacillus centrosporus]|uniref:alpha/beta hydrolase n=1 Tax=Brevibacillus centrosporus TaxID=54910 RepID=UPI003D1D9862